jgi:hypothetical protein
MSKIQGRSLFLAVLSLLTIATLSNGLAKAADDVTEDQIIKALTPAKKPLTRSLSSVPQTQVDPAAAAAEGKFVRSLRNRATRSLSVTEVNRRVQVVNMEDKAAVPR